MYTQQFQTLIDQYLKYLALCHINAREDDIYRKKRDEIKAKIFEYMLFKPFKWDNQYFCFIELLEDSYSYFCIQKESLLKTNTRYNFDYLFSLVITNQIEFISYGAFLTEIQLNSNKIINFLKQNQPGEKTNV